MISYSASNILLGRVSTAAPYWGAFGVDLIALAVAGHIATKLGHEIPPHEEPAAEADIHQPLRR
jgi:hypothetical protein